MNEEHQRRKEKKAAKEQSSREDYMTKLRGRKTGEIREGVQNLLKTEDIKSETARERGRWN